MLAADDGEKRAIQLLPAYVNRHYGPRSSEKFRDVSEHSGRGTQQSSRCNLPPPPIPNGHIHSNAGSRPLTLTTSPRHGQYFYLKRNATYTKLGLKHVASLLAAHVPRDVHTRVKAAVTGINDSLEHEDAYKLIRSVKTELTEKGYVLYKGNRNFESITKVAVIEHNDAGNVDSLEQANQVAYLKGQPNNWRPKRTGKSRRTSGSGCYICGDRHAWRFCPEKRCRSCGQQKPSIDSRKVFVLITSSHSTAWLWSYQ